MINHKLYKKNLLVIIIAVILPGCGSLNMRTATSWDEDGNRERNFFATPLYCGTVADFDPFHFLGLPFSFILDTVLLPADLIGGAFGNRHFRCGHPFHFGL